MAGWLERFHSRHPGTAWRVGPTALTGEAPDGASCRFDVPYPPLADASLDGLTGHLATPRPAGVVLVRKGGFAVALLAGSEVVASKIGQRHVQGRTKAGGWSQQRFARRRDNQAREAFSAAAGHVEEILGPDAAALAVLGVGGDKAAVDTTIGLVAGAAGRELGAVPRVWLGPYPDPKRTTLDAAIRDLRSVRIAVTDPIGTGGPAA